MVDNEMTIVLDEIEGVDITEENIEHLTEMVDDCVEDVHKMTDEFGERIDEHLKQINDSAVYKELGLELTIDMNYEFSLDEREE